MKAVVFAFSFLLFTIVATAQSAAQTASVASAPTLPLAGEVEVLKCSWSKERLNWEQNPFSGPNENFHEMQFRARAEKRVSDAKRSGSTGQQSTAERDAKVDTAIIQAGREQTAPPRYAFYYRASIRNTSSKAVEEIDWDYVFADAMTGEELGRHQFTSTKTIAPGKSKELLFVLSAPPAKRISVYALEKRERSGLKEQIVVVRVKYADGSVWQLQ
jgi:hypothetical protein